MIDTVVVGGPVVTPERTAVLDVGISGEKIAYIAEAGALAPGDVRVLDATGKIVVPGGVEAHAHIFEPMYRGWSQGREVWLQTPEGATRAAIFGGTTTVLSFAFMAVHVREQEFDASIAVQHRREVFDGRSYADYGFHPVLTGTPSSRRSPRSARRSTTEPRRSSSSPPTSPRARPACASTTARRSRSCASARSTARS
jgi:dihydropyrimidinase